jgi:kynureninase
MRNEKRDLQKDLELIRSYFPILEKCIYLNSNSLGAVPKQVHDDLTSFFTMWADDGVSAWEKEWWMLSQKVGDKVAALIGAGPGEVTMMTNATQAHWVALSTQFSANPGKKKTVVMADLDFPSILYSVSQICSFMGWKLEVVQSRGCSGIEAEEIISKINDRTLFVTTSHVYFKSAYIQDIQRIARHARDNGALTLIDGYHAPGTVPVDVKDLGVDFYLGGCLKWLCGGPGNAFLYVRPGLWDSLNPRLTGWFAHKIPFSFSPSMEYTEGPYKFMSGTPPISCLYSAKAGLNIIREIGIRQIRHKSLRQTNRIIEEALARDFVLHTPREEKRRGGAVSFSLPYAHQVKQALVSRGIKVDFRKGKEEEPDVIRVGPHFYTKDEEIALLFESIDEILASGEFKKYSEKNEKVT